MNLTIPTVCGESFTGNRGCAESFLLVRWQRVNVKPQLRPILTISKVLGSVAITNHSQSMIVVETEVWFCLCARN